MPFTEADDIIVASAGPAGAEVAAAMGVRAWGLAARTARAYGGASLRSFDESCGFSCD